MTQYRFDGQVAVVTGAAMGLGRSYATLLASRGASVVVNDLGDSAQGVVDEIKSLGGKAVACVQAVGSQDAGETIIKTAVESFGKVDILVNNAGIVRDKSFHTMTADQIEIILDVHLRGAIYVTQPAFRLMRAQGFGRIVNTTSPAGIYGNFGQVNYSAAKMGLVGFTRTLAREGAKANIKANAISPGAKTAMTEALVPDGMDIPPEAVAPVVAWLCHADCPWSGEIVVAAGGRVARVFTGETRGVYLKNISIETVAENADKISDITGFEILEDMYRSNDILADLMAIG